MRLHLRVIALLLLASSLFADDRHSGDVPEENVDSGERGRLFGYCEFSLNHAFSY
jgi:hypothetical protein